MSTIFAEDQFGPLSPLMNDQQANDIIVDGPTQVYIRHEGKVIEVDHHFKDEAQLMAVIRGLVGLTGRTLDESGPMIDFRLADGSRVNIVLPPLSPTGPVLTIRKYYEDPLTIDDLIRFGSVSVEVAAFLRACVQARLNILVSGGTNSGKTTILNVLLSFVPDEERMVVVEREAAVRLRQKRVVRLEALPPNREGKGAVTVRDLLLNSLKMLPGRIIMGELQGGEALDLMQVMLLGYEGSMSLLHANSPREALTRLEEMATLDNLTVPVLTARKLMASAIDLIVQQLQLQDGSRKIVNISQVQGLQGDLPALAEIFVFEQQGTENGKIVGRMKPTGVQPTFLQRIKATGVPLPPGLFGAANTAA